MSMFACKEFHVRTINLEVFSSLSVPALRVAYLAVYSYEKNKTTLLWYKVYGK